MGYSYPHRIDNGGGEVITFTRVVTASDSDRLELENCVQPGKGPPMHVHLRQTESLTIVSGAMSVEILGTPPTQHGPGDTVTFAPGFMHRFRNSGTQPLMCHGYAKPADNLEYFLTQLYASTKANGGARPSVFDIAFLSHHFRTEFGFGGAPRVIQAIVFPLARVLGHILNKFARFRDAPAAAG